MQDYTAAAPQFHDLVKELYRKERLRDPDALSGKPGLRAMQEHVEKEKAAEEKGERSSDSSAHIEDSDLYCD